MHLGGVVKAVRDGAVNRVIEGGCSAARNAKAKNDKADGRLRGQDAKHEGWIPRGAHPTSHQTELDAGEISWNTGKVPHSEKPEAIPGAVRAPRTCTKL